jgi:hypothetical protein
LAQASLFSTFGSFGLRNCSFSIATHGDENKIKADRDCDVVQNMGAR